MTTGIDKPNMTFKQAAEYLGIDERTFRKYFIENNKISFTNLPLGNKRTLTVLTEDIIRLKQTHTYTNKEYQYYKLIGGING